METPFFDDMIDNFGIWQHTDGHKILISEGYALDDAARGLLVCLSLKKFDKAEILFDYIKKSVHDDGFYGFATSSRKFYQYPASDDATGQVVWAMGYSYSLNFRAKEAKTIIDNCLPSIKKFKHIRGLAYTLLGLIYVDTNLSKILMDKYLQFFRHSDDNWLWPEPVMTYGNGIIAYTLLRYGFVCKDKTVSEFGLKVCNFIESKCGLNNRILAPIGNEGWLPKQSTQVPEYSQQPIDTAYMVWAWLAAFQAFNDDKYYNMAKKWMRWFEGDNIKKERMYEFDTLKCFDGIDRDGVHYHSGAESNICLLLTLHLLDSKNTI